MFSVYQQRKGECIYSVCFIPRFYNNTTGIILQIFWWNIEESTPDTLYHCLRSLPLVLQVFKQIYNKNLQKITIFLLTSVIKTKKSSAKNVLTRRIFTVHPPRNCNKYIFLTPTFTHLWIEERLEFRRKSVCFLCCLVILTNWPSHFF